MNVILKVQIKIGCFMMPSFSENNQQANRIVYLQLAVATVGGTAHHLVKDFKYKSIGITHGSQCVNGMSDML